MSQDKRVWDITHVPDIPQRRRDELEQPASVASACRAGYPKNAHLVGPSGTGKTAAARSLVSQTDGLNAQYVDVCDQRTAKRALWRVLTDAVPSSATSLTPDSSADELLEGVRDAADADATRGLGERADHRGIYGRRPDGKGAVRVRQRGPPRLGFREVERDHLAGARERVRNSLGIPNADPDDGIAVGQRSGHVPAHGSGCPGDEYRPGHRPVLQ